MPRLKLNLCTKCSQTASDLLGAHGQEAMTQAMPSIVADCPKCSHQLPDELRAAIQAGRYETRDKTAPAPDPFVEKGRFTFG